MTAFFVPRDRALTIERRRADIVYRVCGAVVLVCVGTIVWLGVVDLFIDGAGEKKRVGIVELIAFWAFALAWLTKSDFLEWSPLPRPGRCLVQREGRFARFVTWIAETARKVARALRWIC